MSFDCITDVFTRTESNLHFMCIIPPTKTHHTPLSKIGSSIWKKSFWGFDFFVKQLFSHEETLGISHEIKVNNSQCLLLVHWIEVCIIFLGAIRLFNDWTVTKFEFDAPSKKIAELKKGAKILQIDFKTQLIYNLLLFFVNNRWSEF